MTIRCLAFLSEGGIDIGERVFLTVEFVHKVVRREHLAGVVDHFVTGQVIGLEIVEHGLP